MTIPLKSSISNFLSDSSTNENGNKIITTDSDSPIRSPNSELLVQTVRSSKYQNQGRELTADNFENYEHYQELLKKPEYTGVQFPFYFIKIKVLIYKLNSKNNDLI